MPFGLQPKPAAHARALDPAGAWIRRKSLVMPFWQLPTGGISKTLVDDGVGDVRATVSFGEGTTAPWGLQTTLGYNPRTAPSTTSYLIDGCPEVLTPAITDKVTIAGVWEMRVGSSANVRNSLGHAVPSAPEQFGPRITYQESTRTVNFSDSAVVKYSFVQPESTPFVFVATIVDEGGDMNLWIDGEFKGTVTTTTGSPFDFTRWTIGGGLAFTFKTSQGTIPYLFVVSPRIWGPGEARKFCRDPWAAIRPRR